MELHVLILCLLNSIYFYSTVLCVIAWIMKTVGDLKSFVDHFNNDN